MFDRIWDEAAAFFARYRENDLVQPGSAEWQAQMLMSHNRQRIKKSPLILNDKLMMVAQKHADWMAKTGILSHTGDGRSTMESRVNAEGFRWTLLGENIAYGYSTVESVVKAWMGSYGHRRNIMNSSFTQVGFGKGVHKDGTIFWCANFAKEQ
jgi:uncharacterized protein YkwD